jgi:uncharacterized protein (DUF433 family)
MTGWDMALTLTAELPPLTQDDTGTVRVRGSRITLDVLAHAMRSGRTAVEVAADYDLDLADVYAVFSYCLRYKVAVDAYLDRREQEAAEMRKMVEGRQGPQPSREELLTRAKARRGE